MSSFTKFVFDGTLKESNEPVYDYLTYRFKFADTLGSNPFNDHPFFQCQRWSQVLAGHDKDTWLSKSYETENGLVIHIEIDILNYCHSIDWCLLFIAPLINLDYECKTFISYEDNLEDSHISLNELFNKINLKLETEAPSLDMLGSKILKIWKLYD